MDKDVVGLVEYDNEEIGKDEGMDEFMLPVEAVVVVATPETEDEYEDDDEAMPEKGGSFVGDVDVEEDVVDVPNTSSMIEAVDEKIDDEEGDELVVAAKVAVVVAVVEEEEGDDEIGFFDGFKPIPAQGGDGEEEKGAVKEEGVGVVGFVAELVLDFCTADDANNVDAVVVQAAEQTAVENFEVALDGDDEDDDKDDADDDVDNFDES